MRSQTVLAASLLLATALVACGAPSWREDIESIESFAYFEVLPQAGADASQTESAAPLSGLVSETEAVRRAIEASPRVDAILGSLGASRGERMTAGALPPLSLEAEYMPRPDAEVGLRLEAELTESLLAPIRGQASDARHEATRATVAAALIDVGLRTRMAYHRLQAASEKLALATDMLAAFEAAEAAARALSEAGNLSDLELWRHRVAMLQARDALAAIALDADDARRELAALIGADPDDPAWSVAATLEPAGSEEAVRADIAVVAVENSLQLDSGTLMLEALGRESRLARIEARMPGIALGGIAIFDGAAAETDSAWSYGAVAVLELPLFASGRGHVVATDAEYEAALSTQVADARDVRATADRVLQVLDTAGDSARGCVEDTVPAATELRRQTLLQYNAMQLGIFDLLAAYRAELDARSRCIDWLRTYWDARAAQNALLAGGGATELGAAPSAMPSAGANAGGH